MHFFSCQFSIIGPNVLFDISHRCHLSEDLAKHPAATNRNGVVGSRGKNIPSTASPTKIKPNDLYKDKDGYMRRNALDIAPPPDKVKNSKVGYGGVRRLVEAVRRRPKIGPVWQVHFGHKPVLMD